MLMAYVEKPPIDELYHHGVGHLDGGNSGRYPWGSGKEPYQNSGDFLARVEELRKKNITFTDKYGKTWTGDTAVAKSMGLDTTKFRVQVALATNERRSSRISYAKHLQDEEKLGASEIARRMTERFGESINESTVRGYLKENSERRALAAQATADILKKMIDEKGMLDVGLGAERYLNVSREKLEQALYLLEREGYPTYSGGVPQVTNPGQQTNRKVICPPGTEHKEIYDFDKVNTVFDYRSHDGGETFDPKFVPPKSIDKERVKIRYGDEVGPDGFKGIDKDGVIQIRRGVEDLNLGESHYAQVRILVDKTHYLKGMAMYSDDIPDGYDIVFNTNKPSGTPFEKVLKKIKDDPENPFGANLKEEGGQSYYTDKDGNRQLSAINKTREEGDWQQWSKTLPSQFLAKQSQELVKKQLALAEADKLAEFEEICAYTNPVIKKNMLKTFAEECDSAALHLQAAALPRQSYKVILPLNDISENEVYAPTYRDGEKVALIRYPHGGTFEIPILTVNNKQATGKATIGENPIDAIGINGKVAARLSGADYDGDTVMVIPTRGNGRNLNVNIVNQKPLEGLVGFDPGQYKIPEGDTKTPRMKNTGLEVGKISNLITDMTIKDATPDELARAVRHSMVVIDAAKHEYDYKQSEKDNRIDELKRIYQKHTDDDGYGGASTILSKAKSPVQVEKTKGSPIIDPETGEVSYKKANETYTVTRTLKNGTVVTETKTRMKDSRLMTETKDAHTLSSGHPIEELYADYANYMKGLANSARKEYVRPDKMVYSAEAKAKYLPEVQSLNAKLNVAIKNKPRERQAQAMANSKTKAMLQTISPDNHKLTPTEKKELDKYKQRQLIKARELVGAKREPINITDREWEAIQAGAITSSKLSQIANYCDSDQLRQRVLPKATQTLTPARENKAKAMASSGYTIAEIADSLGVSTSTISRAIH